MNTENAGDYLNIMQQRFLSAFICVHLRLKSKIKNPASVFCAGFRYFVYK